MIYYCKQAADGSSTLLSLTSGWLERQFDRTLANTHLPVVSGRAKPQMRRVDIRKTKLT